MGIESKWATSHEIAGIAEDNENQSDCMVEEHLAIVFLRLGDSMSDEWIQVIGKCEKVIVFNLVRDINIWVVFKNLDGVAFT